MVKWISHDLRPPLLKFKPKKKMDFSPAKGSLEIRIKKKIGLFTCKGVTRKNTKKNRKIPRSTRKNQKKMEIPSRSTRKKPNQKKIEFPSRSMHPKNEKKMKIPRTRKNQKKNRSFPAGACSPKYMEKKMEFPRSTRKNPTPQ